MASLLHDKKVRNEALNCLAKLQVTALQPSVILLIQKMGLCIIFFIEFALRKNNVQH